MFKTNRNPFRGMVRLSLMASLMLAVSACDDAEEGIRFNNTVFPVGEVQWRSDVTAHEREVIGQLIGDMVKVESCQFLMGAQGKSYRRANYVSNFTSRDTIWQCKENPALAYSRVVKPADTTWYNANQFEFIDTLRTKRDTAVYTVVYRTPTGYWVGPVVPVTMPDYYIGKMEVTQGQWTAVMHRMPKGNYCIVPELSGQAAWYDVIGKGDNFAAYNIWYEDAVAFCDSLSAKTGLNFALPTEAEWECAARGGRYCRGYKFAGSDQSAEVGWTYSNACAQKRGEENYGIHQGGELLANEIGVYDMCGNVAEWVSNAYYKYSCADVVNPQGKTVTGTDQDTLILRGGSWQLQRYTDFVSAARKQCIMSSYSSERSKQSAFVNCGFRIVLRN